jgi:hypothetical protein
VNDSKARLTSALATGLLFCSAVAHSQEKAPIPNNNAAMQEAMRLMMPSDGHKIFDKLAGKWTGKLKIWSGTAPTQPPMESNSDSESKLVLGGRYLIEESKGTVMRMPMQRMSVLGYDNFKKVYTLVFFSSLETATNIATGTLDAPGKVLILRGEFDGPQGKEPFKNVIRFDNDDVHTFESYKIMPDGREIKLIEETSTRVK